MMEQEESKLTIMLAAGSLVLSILLHADLDDNHGRVPALTCHFIAMMAFGRALSGVYMWHAHTEITCEPWIGKFNHAGYTILAAHVLHLLLLADFAYFYCKNVTTMGLQSSLQLPQSIMV